MVCVAFTPRCQEPSLSRTLQNTTEPFKRPGPRSEVHSLPGRSTTCDLSRVLVEGDSCNFPSWLQGFFQMDFDLLRWNLGILRSAARLRHGSTLKCRSELQELPLVELGHISHFDGNADRDSHEAES